MSQDSCDIMAPPRGEDEEAGAPPAGTPTFRLQVESASDLRPAARNLHQSLLCGDSCKPHANDRSGKVPIRPPCDLWRFRKANVLVDEP